MMEVANDGDERKMMATPNESYEPARLLAGLQAAVASVAKAHGECELAKAVQSLSESPLRASSIHLNGTNSHHYSPRIRGDGGLTFVRCGGGDDIFLNPTDTKSLLALLQLAWKPVNESQQAVVAAVAQQRQDDKEGGTADLPQPK